jgi:hypothetical protein
MALTRLLPQTRVVLSVGVVPGGQVVLHAELTVIS